MTAKPATGAAEPGGTGWEDGIGRLVAARKLLVALDFDGTLAPLVDNPEDSRPVPGARTALARLARVDRVQLALVSGRPAADLARLASPPDGTWLAGSHGAEQGRMSGAAAVLEPVELTAAQSRELDAIRAGLEDLAAAGPGAWIESKPLAAVFHTRPMADRAAASHLEEQAAGLGEALGGHVLAGKMVVEISILPAGKAAALTRLRHAAGADRLVFAGDDTTDELALDTIHPPDLGIKVGPGATTAELRLPDPLAVAAFLHALADALV
ncbi:MAG: trehalose-phosphatase [Bifidobacteriaceae bacterium]|nr:trehalose-phosphatase [Bifidobacteriaceae bacterium]